MSVQDLKTQEEKKPLINTSNITGDLIGGVTAGIVALPLAIAFGAGAFPDGVEGGAIAGLWGAIIVGFFAAAFGGTGSQISGPTGPMVVVFAGLLTSLMATADKSLSVVDQFGSVAPLLFAAVVIGGILQILMGVFKLGKYIKLVPFPVISGFMSGIGVIIIILQTARLFGGTPERGGVFAALEAIPGAVTSPNMLALGIGILTLVIVFFWGKVVPAKVAKLMPSTLAALIIGTVAGIFLMGDNIGAQIVDDAGNVIGNAPLLPLLGEIPRDLPAIVFPSITTSTFLIVMNAAIVLAVLGAIDSLLTSLVADNVTRTRHNSDQELIGQGIGNTLAGLVGGLPGAGATMRTMVNIRSGGAFKISGMVHGVTLLAIVLVFAPLASKIPNAVLAGILVKVGYDIIDFSYIRTALKGPRWDYFLMILVLVLTVFVDLITAVGIGVFLAALGYVKLVADEQTEAVNENIPAGTLDAEKAILDAADGKILLYAFGGPLSFGAAADLGHHVRQRVRLGASAIVLDFTRKTSIDVSAVRAVETIAADAQDDGKLVFTVNMNDKVRAMLSGLSADGHLSDERAFDNRLEALEAASAALKAK